MNKSIILLMSKMKVLLLLLTFLYISQLISVDPNTTLFLDQYGRYTIFHGVNVVQKLFPFYPQLDHFDSNYSLCDQDLENLQKWGFNSIRLHVAWEGVEPSKGNYNYTYIEKLKEIVQKCNNFGIYVLLDAHQDLFNRQFCGEGFPDWAIQRTNFPFPVQVHIDYDEHGNPNRTQCLSVDFALFYTS
jgi:endoglycosylceramidase